MDFEHQLRVGSGEWGDDAAGGAGGERITNDYSLFPNKVIELEIVSFYKNHLRGEQYEKNTGRY
ncbi:hypothetical protein COO91_05946 [Nostoc flagelliforme CCNUN1]|uniref:Uncharacterized protein n=1 Tax=Nostoc flagelliforme CCNUN1 TaxID=2038116 RepID=A0A2K8SX53_9NOSO|nr:hypothetical protein COO91_05946 [Nostoc flagelliforme CCNUN1]